MTSPLPDAAVLDTSVLLRFFHDHGDAEQRAADAVLQAWQADRLQLALLDLSVYELVNVSVRRLRHSPQRVRSTVESLFRLGMPLIGVDAILAASAADLAANLELSGYDAAFLAAARRTGLPLLTADVGIAAVADDAISLRSLAGQS